MIAKLHDENSQRMYVRYMQAVDINFTNHIHHRIRYRIGRKKIPTNNQKIIFR